MAKFRIGDLIQHRAGASRAVVVDLFKDGNDGEIYCLSSSVGHDKDLYAHYVDLAYIKVEDGN